MTTQVFYRKWRPRTFHELVGQDHVTTVLRQAVKQGRVSHAYLFCGPRGTGKTTTARVLTRALSCIDPKDGEPDNNCALCQSLDQGHFLDLIEMDAASNRGIDDIRNIREKVNFSPAEGRYKVYIVDEAHMLTEAASNAFLKTLEEPPPHVIFILCTTEPHKVLPTIISRCQRYDFRRLPTETMVTRLRFLCDQEGIEAETKALEALARAASGSLRDAENLLERTVVSHGQQLETTFINEMLGLSDIQWSKDLVTYLLLDNTPSALAIVGRAAQAGVDMRQIHRQTLELLRAVLMTQSGAADTLDVTVETLSEVETLAHKVPTQRVMRYLKALGTVNMRLDSATALPLELAIVEASLMEATKVTAGSDMTHAESQKGQSVSVNEQSRRLAEGQQASGLPKSAQEPENPDDTKVLQLDEDPPALSNLSPATSDTPSNSLIGSPVSIEAWSKVVQALRRHRGRRFFLGALLKDCNTPQIEHDVMILPFNHRSNMERMEAELEEVQSRMALEEALQTFLGSSYRVKMILDGGDSGGGRPAATTSPLVRAARALGGRILEERKLDE